MRHVRKLRHPRKIVNGEKKMHSWCFSKTGWHCSSKSWRDSDIRDMGVGISCYFKFLKFMMMLFLWFSILSIPAYFFYIEGNLSGVRDSSVKYALSALTLGNIGQCNLFSIINIYLA